MGVANAERVQQEDSVILKASPGDRKVLLVIFNSDVFEHADREDAVERSVNVTIVLQTELEAATARRFETRNTQKLQFFRV